MVKMRWRWSAAYFLVLLPNSQASTCPINKKDPYMNEASPFGYPLAPADWDWKRQDCWKDKYAMCGGTRQSPINLVFDLNPIQCRTNEEGLDGALKSMASYVDASDHSDVRVSSYMRTVMVDGKFGTLKLAVDGHDVEYEATQVHLAVESLHLVNGSSLAGEMIVFHKPKGGDMRSGVVAVSVLFQESDDHESATFTSLGFPADDKVMNQKMTTSWKVAPFSIAADLDKALGGTSYTYQGSIPVPPCHETVNWIVLTSPQPVKKAQITKLREILNLHADGVTKRTAIPRNSGEQCRELSKNTLKIGASHSRTSCSSLDEAKRATTSSCWVDQCSESPINILPQSAGTAPTNTAASLMHYGDTEHVILAPSSYTLDATVEHGGNFGYLLLNGRKFDARTVSIKPVSAHTINGMTYDAELMIEHRLYGDDIGAAHGGAHDAAVAGHGTVAHDSHSVGGGHSASAASGGHTASATAGHGDDSHSSDGHGSGHGGGHGGAHRRLAGQQDGGHTVYVSVPLKMGRESTLLRKLGLGVPSSKHAIRDGNSYKVHDLIDLGKDLNAAFSGSYFWYSGSPVTPGCPAWGVRWMVFETPIEISFEQMNYLNLPVSGLDSTRATQPLSGDYKAMVSNTFLPEYAVDNDKSGTCDPNEEWNYANARCWRIHYPQCDGEMQSPINILTSAVTTVGEDNFLSRTSWKPARELRVENAGGHSVIVHSNQFGYTHIIGSNGFTQYYQVVNFQVHMPSEHMVDGKQFPLEIQVVHKKQYSVEDLENDDVMITSFMFEMGEESGLLKQLYLPGEQLPNGEYKTIEKPVDLMRAFGPALDGEFYRYDGSVSAPNCAEVAKWFVFTNTFTLSEAQWSAFKAMFPNPSNNRPVQPLNGRPIARNSFVEGTYVDYRFFLGREMARDRETPAAGLITIPIIGTILLCSFIMLATFVFEDSSKKSKSAGGLAEIIGAPSNRH